MSQITEALAKLSDGVYKQARTREEVEKQLSFFPYKLSEEAYDYYQWDGAPVGRQFPDDWNGNNSTYDCQLDGTLGIQADYIHFLSIEDVETIYSTDPIYNQKSLPFVSSEYYFLLITGSEHEVKTSPIVKREDFKEKLFFPSLTNMMMAIVESLEKVNSLAPLIKNDYDTKGYGTAIYQDQCDYEDEIVMKIAKKHGSPTGSII